ncbi:hypothetical protein Tsubulata_015079 [Turnera subulata]|uniref:Peptidase S8/S53 domain-containing protein n=1 Tax=Turnera subulata TaxID=218843 RepID=A0A9Q0JKE8_9ROSI|nr:hypothetical protein Tsubulata_015079 [Turnera subulata]
MATPHVAGVAAAIIALNRNWSPAAIKSALMTSSTSVDDTRQPIRAYAQSATPYDFGSGQLNPDQSRFFFDFTVDDAINFLCFHASDVCPVVIMARGDVTSIAAIARLPSLHDGAHTGAGLTSNSVAIRHRCNHRPLSLSRLCSLLFESNAAEGRPAAQTHLLAATDGRARHHRGEGRAVDLSLYGLSYAPVLVASPSSHRRRDTWVSRDADSPFPSLSLDFSSSLHLNLSIRLYWTVLNLVDGLLMDDMDRGGG